MRETSIHRPHRFSTHATGWRAALLTVAVLASGCGGGGGGGGSTPAGGGSAGGGAVTLSADVYPLSSGDTRTWHITTGTLAGTTRTERVGAPVAVNGGTALAVRTDGGDLAYALVTATAVTQVPAPGADALTAAAGPIDLLRFGQVAGTTVETFNRTLSVDIDGDGRIDSADVQITSTFVGQEAVSTPAGNFAGAAKVRSVMTVTARLAAVPGVIAVVTVTADEWFAPGVGPVRSVTTTTAAGVPTVVDTEELAAYGVGSRHSETVAPALLSSSPAADSATTTQPTIVLNFSEALDPLTLDGVAGLTLVDAAGQAVPTTRSIANAGTRITLTPQAALPDGRYEIRLGSGLTDLANNPLPAAVRAFTVDTQGPRIASSTPAQGSDTAALTGTVLLHFNEPVFASTGGSAVTLFVQDFAGSQPLAGTIQGNDIVATLAAPLLRNHDYTLGVTTPLVDAVGNPAAYDGTAVSFRTDPGPLARPTALMAGVEVGAVTLGDIDGDGRPDIVFAAHTIGTMDDHFIGVRLKQADGHYADATRLYTLPPFQLCLSRNITVADFNGDGRADLALSGCSGGLTALIRQADGSFVAETPDATVNASRFPALDLDGDGDGSSEIVAVHGGEIRFLHRDPTGAWAAALTVDGGSSAYIPMLRLVDLDGDGRRDMVWVRAGADNIHYELAWALRQGPGFGAVRSRTIDATVDLAPPLAVADVTGDGRPDLALLLRLGNDSRLAVYAQTAAGDFADPVLSASAYDAATVDAGDVDGDGRADLLVTHSTTRQLGVYLQDAAGGLQAERTFETGYAYYEFFDTVVLADLNGDGRTDVVVGADVLLGRPVTGAWPMSVPPSDRRGALAVIRPVGDAPASVAATVPRRGTALGGVARGLTRAVPAAAAAR